MSNPYGLSNLVEARGSEIAVQLAPRELAATEAGGGVRTPVDGGSLGAEPGRERARSPGAAGAVPSALPPSSPSFPALPPGVGSTPFLAQLVAQETMGEAVVSVDRGPAKLAEPSLGRRSDDTSVEAHPKGETPRRDVLMRGWPSHGLSFAGVDIEV